MLTILIYLANTRRYYKYVNYLKKGGAILRIRHLNIRYVSNLTRGLMVVASTFLLVGATTVNAAASDAVNASPTSTLQKDVNAIRDIGTTGVLAYTTDGTSAMRARAGVAVLGGNQPVDWASHVRIGSNTKTFVATVMLQLEAEGKLSLNDTVERWLPGVVQGNGNHGEHITLRNLLQHTSGIFDYTADPGFDETIITPTAFYQNRFNTYTPQQLVSIALSHAPDFAPGARWEYSNTNYIIAGMVIKAVTSKTWDVEVKNRIITPLGLTETTEPGTNPNLPVPFPRGYELFDTSGTLYDTTLHNMSWGGSAGSLISTPKDVNTFFKALVRGNLLPPAQLAEMKTTVPMGKDYEEFWPGAAYGLGVMRINLPCGGTYWSHGGDVFGYNNTNGVTPDGDRSAMVASSTNTIADPVFGDNSIRTTNNLVWHALCKTGDSTTYSAESHSSAVGKPGYRLKL
jgi:D-alanyl-D-alanine carboxypeptidase